MPTCPVPRETPDITAERLALLQDLIPEAFSEGRIDFDKLRAALGDLVDDQPERYSFSWAGKTNAIRILQTPTRATLVPDREQSLDFDTTSNLFLEGDNLEVLKLLYKPYFGRVKMIYIDPPYNTGNDFVYPDNYADPLDTYLRLTGQRDAEGNLLTTNPETSGRYHSAWLSMMYPRLFLARQLLREDGAICVSIGEEEHPRLRMLLDETFGEDQYRNTMLVRRYDKNLNRQFMDQGLNTLNVGAEQIVVYSRSSEFALNPVCREASEERQAQGYWKGFWNAADRPKMRYPLLGVTPTEGQWKWQRAVAMEAVANYQEYLASYADTMPLEEYWDRTGQTKRFIRRNQTGDGKNQGVEHWIAPSAGILRSSNWTDMLASETLTSLGLSFDNPKSTVLLKTVVQLCCDPEDIILDFFAGSCTTAQAVLELNREDGGNRRFIMVQLPEPTERDDFPTIADIGKERIRRVVARMKEAEAGKLDLPDRETPEDLGFRAFKLAPTHLQPWTHPATSDPAAVQAALQQQLEPLLEGWTEAGVVAEVALKEGFGLNYREEPVAGITTNSVRRLTDPDRGQSLFVCLDERLSDETWQGLNLKPDDLFVCRDRALTDTQAANLALQCRLHTL